MGEGNAKKARIYLKIATIGVLLLDFVIAFLLVINKNWVSKLFTTNKAILGHLNDSLTTIAIVLIF